MLNQGISVIVDYAHTPDSLENALNAACPFLISGRLKLRPFYPKNRFFRRLARRGR